MCGTWGVLEVQEEFDPLTCSDQLGLWKYSWSACWPKPARSRGPSSAPLCLWLTCKYKVDKFPCFTHNLFLPVYNLLVWAAAWSSLPLLVVHHLTFSVLKKGAQETVAQNGCLKLWCCLGSSASSQRSCSASWKSRWIEPHPRGARRTAEAWACGRCTGGEGQTSRTSETNVHF